MDHQPLDPPRLVERAESAERAWSRARAPNWINRLTWKPARNRAESPFTHEIALRPLRVLWYGVRYAGRMRFLLASFCLFAVTACSAESPIGPTVPLDEQFTLAPGALAAIDSTSLRVQFREVTGDSRCPADAVCIQGGDAIVHIRAAAENAAVASYELHTGDSSRASAIHGGFRIELVMLEPYPFSSRPVEPEDYRATLRVTRR